MGMNLNPIAAACMAIAAASHNSWTSVGDGRSIVTPSSHSVSLMSGMIYLLILLISPR